jgi:hypothetical protein
MPGEGVARPRRLGSIGYQSTFKVDSWDHGRVPLTRRSCAVPERLGESWESRCIVPDHMSWTVTVPAVGEPLYVPKGTRSLLSGQGTTLRRVVGCISCRGMRDLDLRRSMVRRWGDAVGTRRRGHMLVDMVELVLSWVSPGVALWFARDPLCQP